MEAGDLVIPKSICHFRYGAVGWIVKAPGHDHKVVVRFGSTYYLFLKRSYAW